MTPKALQKMQLWHEIISNRNALVLIFFPFKEPALAEKLD